MFAQPTPSQYQTTNIGDVFMVYVVRLQQATNYINSDNTDPLLLKLAKEDMTKAVYELAGAIRAFQSAGIFNMPPFNVPTQAFGPMAQRSPVDLNNFPWGYFNQYKGFPNQGQPSPPWVVGQQSTSMPNQMPNYPVYLNSNVLALLRFNASQLTRIDEILRSPNSDEAAKAKALQDLTEVSAEYRGIVNTLSALFEINSRTVPRAITIDNNSSFQPSLQPSLNPDNGGVSVNKNAVSLTTDQSQNEASNLDDPPVKVVHKNSSLEKYHQEKMVSFFFSEPPQDNGWLNHNLKEFFSHSDYRDVLKKLEHLSGCTRPIDLPREILKKNVLIYELVKIGTNGFGALSSKAIGLTIYCSILNETFYEKIKEGSGSFYNTETELSKALLSFTPANSLTSVILKTSKHCPMFTTSVIHNLLAIYRMNNYQFSSYQELENFFKDNTSWVM